MENSSTKSEWIATVKYLLSSLEMDNHFINPQQVNTEIFSKLCATKLRDLFITQWHLQLSGVSRNQTDTSKLHFYKLFKVAFKREKYLDLIPNFQLRKCISKFRCSDHILEIEIGRHKKLKVEERICKICKMAVETEEHFLRFCPKYKQLRSRYLGNISNFSEWVQILKCEDKKSSYNLANFLMKGFKIRKHLM